MRVIGTFHPSSSVSRSVKCALTQDKSLEHLVVAKTDKLEVYSLRPDGLKKECSTDMWGRVVGLQAIPAKEPGRSNLLVMTDHPEPKIVLMSYVIEEEVPTLVATSFQSLFDRTARPSEYVMDFSVDPTGSVVVASCYSGKLKVIEIKKGKLNEPFDVSLPELNLLAFNFLDTEDESRTLALLHFNHRQEIQLLARDLKLKELELSADHSDVFTTTLLSDRTFPSLDPPPILVPVPGYTTGSEEDEEDEESPAHRGGVLVLGGKKIVFYENASKPQQETRKGKQKRIKKRISSGKPEEVAKAREKEKERETRKLPPRASVKWPWAAVTAWCALDEDGRRFLLGDVYGRLAMLAFDDRRMCLTILPLGEASPATCLTYLSSQVLYLGSHAGNSQLLRIHPSPIANASSVTLPTPPGVTTVPPSSLVSSDKGKGRLADDGTGGRKDGRVVGMKGTYLEVLENHDNIAPIMDAVLADIDRSGQPQVVTCSGSHSTGSLRVIRTEADFKEQARLEGLPGITNVWPIKARSSDSVHSHVVVSTLRDTFVFSLAEKEVMTNLDPASIGFATGVPTFTVGNIPRRKTVMNGGRSTSSYLDSPLIVQITSEGIRLIEHDNTLMSLTKYGNGWYPKQLGGDYANREVVAAAMSPSQYIVGLTGGRLVLLNLGQDDRLDIVTTRNFPDEICAISCDPIDPAKPYTTSLAVSFWGSNSVHVLTIEAGGVLSTQCAVDFPALPRTVRLHNFGRGTRTKDPEFRLHLLVGLADGTLVTYALRDGSLEDRKASSLGDAPASLSVCAVDGQTAVFASGARSNILFWDGRRLRTSPVAIKDMVKGATLNTPAFPSCLMVATSSTLLIGNVRGLDKMQIRTIPLGLDSPRKIAHHAFEEVFGVATIHTTPVRVGDYEEVKGSLKLMDAHTLQQLDAFACDADEEPTSLLALSTEGAGVSSPAFCLGTVFIRSDETEPSEGRIVLFGVSSNQGPRGPALRSLQNLGSKKVQGCVYALVRLSDNLIAAAVNTSVVIFRIQEGDVGATPMVLQELGKWNHNYFVTNLAFDGERILVGDAISSVSAIRWDEEGQTVQTVARDYGPLWPVAIESTGNGIIGANSDCNLFSFSFQQRGLKQFLEKDGAYQLDDVVNKIMRGALSSVDPTGEQTVRPGHVFFTASGRIGAILEMDDDVALHMTALQRNMAKELLGPGDVEHTRRRAPATARGHTDAEGGAYGFLDGDFLEAFLAHEDAEELLEGEVEAERVTMPVAAIKAVLVQMQSLH